MNAILIDTRKREVGSVILKESLKVLSVQKESNWYTHSVWHPEKGEEVKWFSRGKGDKIDRLCGKILELDKGLAYVLSGRVRHIVPLTKLFP